MADAHVAAQAVHVVLAEDVANQAVALAQVQVIAFTGHDPGSILTAMLQHGQRIVEVVADL